MHVSHYLPKKIANKILVKSTIGHVYKCTFFGLRFVFLRAYLALIKHLCVKELFSRF